VMPITAARRMYSPIAVRSGGRFQSDWWLGGRFPSESAYNRSMRTLSAA
jgi:hypothetical protein